MFTYNKQKNFYAIIGFLPFLQEKIRYFSIQAEKAFSMKAT